MMSDNQTNRNCLECGQALGAGRSDRKYCDDVCRTAYNNRRRSEHNPDPEPSPGINPNFEKIFQILLQNRQTLRLWSIFKEEPYPLRDLIGRGLNLKYFTSECQISGLLFKFCFDYGYHITESGRVYIEERTSETFADNQRNHRPANRPAAAVLVSAGTASAACTGEA